MREGDFINNFGEFLKSVRKGIITQRELAKKIKVGFPYISKLENNIETTPSDEVLIRLANTLNVDEDEMFLNANKIHKDIYCFLINRPEIIKLLRVMKEEEVPSKLVDFFTETVMQRNDSYRSNFYNSKNKMLIIDPTTIEILDANLASEEFYHYSSKELRNMSISDINTLSEKQIKQYVEKAKTESQNYFHFKHRIGNGDIKKVAVCSRPIVIKGKVCLHSIIEDIQ